MKTTPSGIILNLLLFFCAVGPTYASEIPQVLYDFFDPNSSFDKGANYTGEMKETFSTAKTLGEYLPPTLQKEFRLIDGQETRIVVGVSVHDDVNSEDWYVYLVKVEERWRISAIRTLSATGPIWQIVSILTSNTRKTPEEIWTLENAKLTLSSDSSLKQHLLKNLDKFEELINSIKASNQESVKELTRKLLIHTISKSSDLSEIWCVVGGILDNTVNYLYLQPGGSVPQMSENENIIVERIAENWYLVKTT